MKLSVFLVLLVVSSIVIVSGSTFAIINDLVDAEKQIAMETVQTVSNNLSGLISYDLNERISDVEILSNPHGAILSTTLTLDEKRDYLLQFLKNYPDYDSVSVYDKKGTKIIDTRNLGIGNNISKTAIFQQTVENLFYYDRSPIFTDDLEKTALGNILPIKRFSSALFTSDGEFAGIIVANYSIVSLFDNLLSVSDNSFEYELLNNERQSLTRSLDYDTLDDDVYTNLIPDAVNIMDTWIIATSQLPETGRYVDNDELLVLVKIDTKIAFHDIVEKQSFLQLITLITLVIFISLTLIIMKKLNKELFYIASILDDVVVGKKLLKKKLLFAEMARLESKIVSAENILNEEKSSNQEKLDMFEKTSEIIKLVSSGNFSKKFIFDSSIDSSEISELKLNINHAVEQLSRVESDRSSFSAMITHELKTPLVPIKGYAEMLKKEKLGPLTIDQKDAISEILTSVESLHSLIQSILTAQKESSDNSLGDLTTLSSTKLIENAYNKMSPTMEPKKIHFKKDISTDSLISIEYEKILEVFVNLIQNSIDFVPAIDGVITIGCTKHDVGILCFVKDNGIGMTQDQQQKIFKKFYQVDTTATREHGGTGLGLSICRSIIEKHGGTIWATGSPNSGTDIFFTLPSKDTTGTNFN